VASPTPDTLIKYCSANTAQQILSDQTLRWSAPQLFNDPFELNCKSPLNFEPGELLQAAVHASSAMIFSPHSPSGSSPLVTAIRRWRDEERFDSPEEAHGVLEELLGQVVEARQKTLEKILEDWRQFSGQLRICSFSARHDIFACWQRFSDQHKGVALRFQADSYTALAKPLAVRYSDDCPEITSLKDELSTLITGRKHNPQAQFQDHFLSKAKSCNLEKEWRCFYRQPNNGSPESEQDYCHRPFKEEELEAAYLGVAIGKKDKQQLLELLQSRYPDAKIYQAIKVSGRYELKFNRLNK
jgi:hypothetical protein